MTDLVVRDVHKTLGPVRVLRGASFTAARGEIVALLGASGSGKTTLLRCIAGLEQPEQGYVEIGRQVVVDRAPDLLVPPERRDIGFVFQSYALWPHRSVFDNVAYGLVLRKVPEAQRRARVEETLERLGLRHLAARYPDQLSGGQQQRVAICRALVYEPKALLLDEPLSNLDAKLREEARFWIRQLILRLQMCAVIVTHDQSEALSIADRVIILKDGIIVQEGSPQQIYNEPTDIYAAEFLGSNNVIPGTLSARCDGQASIAGADWTLDGVLKCGDREASGAGTAIVRVERVRIADSGGENRVLMTREGSLYLGDHWEHRLRRGDLKVKLRSAADLGADQVWCELPREAVWIFPTSG